MNLKIMTATLVVGMLSAGTVLALDSSFLEQQSSRLHQMTSERSMKQADANVPVASDLSYWEQRSARLHHVNGQGISNRQTGNRSIRTVMSEPWWR